MKRRADYSLLSYCLGIMVLISGTWLVSALGAVSPTLQRLANGDVRIEQTTQAGQYYRVEASPDLQTWAAMVTLLSPGLLQHTDSAAGYFAKRFYRINQITGSNLLTGDHLGTKNGDV